MGTATLKRQTRLNVRATQEQKDLITRAARMTNSTISEFVLGRAYRDAQEILAEQNDFRLPDRQWRAFNQALDAPPKRIEALRRLLIEDGVFDG